MEELLKPIYFEDMQIGDTAVSPARTITEADIVNFACLTGDFNSLHTDAEFAKNSIAGQRIAHGMLVWSISIGLNTRTPYVMAQQKQMRAMTTTELKFRKPTLIGDTVHVVQEVVEKVDTRPGSDAAKVIFKRTVYNQRGEELIIGMVSQLVQKRGTNG